MMYNLLKPPVARRYTHRRHRLRRQWTAAGLVEWFTQTVNMIPIHYITQSCYIRRIYP